MTYVSIQRTSDHEFVLVYGNQHISVHNQDLDALLRTLEAYHPTSYTPSPHSPRSAVLIVDGHPLTRKGICSTLQTLDLCLDITEAGSVEQAVDLLKTIHPTIAIISFRLYKACGIVICHKILEMYPDTIVIMFGPTDSPMCPAMAWKAGALGFLDQKSDPGDMITILQHAVNYRYAWTKEQLKCIHEWEIRQGARLRSLTSREREIFVYLGNRVTNKEIAQALSLSEKTVEHYVGRVLGKLNITSRTQVANLDKNVFCALEQNIL